MVNDHLIASRKEYNGQQYGISKWLHVCCFIKWINMDLT